MGRLSWINECLIWGTPAAVDPALGDYTVWDSSRAGGKYRVSGTEQMNVHGLSEDQKLVLTTWLCEQRRLGVEVPAIDSYNLIAVASHPPLTFSKRIERTILYLANISKRVDTKFQFGEDARSRKFLAETESRDVNELAGLLVMMHDMGLVKGNVQTRSVWSLGPKGWERAEELMVRAVDSTQGFVAMWFGEEVQAAYDNGIKLAIEDAGYKPMRIDSIEHNGKVDDRIIAEIRRSRFLVADFSCQKEKVRGGVYYEAGFAEGLNIPVFWTCRQESMKDLHFDTRQYNHIVWKNPAELREKLTNRIRAVLGQGSLEN